MRKDNLPIIVGISLPIVLVAIIAASIYIPAYTTEPPTVDFVFTDNNYAYGQHYEVRGDKLVLIEDPYYRKEVNPEPNTEPKLYRYDTEKGKAVMMTIKEAQTLHLDPSPISREGFRMEQGGGNGGVFPFFFFDGNNQAMFLRKGAYSEELMMPTQNIWNIQFLGWINE